MQNYRAKLQLLTPGRFGELCCTSVITRGTVVFRKWSISEFVSCFFGRKSEYCEKSCASVIKHHAKHKITQEMPENLESCLKKKRQTFQFLKFPKIVAHQRAKRENRKLKFKGQKVKIDWGSTLSN